MIPTPPLGGLPHQEAGRRTPKAIPKQHMGTWPEGRGYTSMPADSEEQVPSSKLGHRVPFGLEGGGE
ncbi:hypothetical protein SUGI_0645680 [Cryptomeria japonica]|nr:hypothetical protein SUGI_0645680 [Cryptomeria japonica]